MIVEAVGLVGVLRSSQIYAELDHQSLGFRAVKIACGAAVFEVVKIIFKRVGLPIQNHAERGLAAGLVLGRQIAGGGGEIVKALKLQRFNVRAGSDGIGCDRDLNNVGQRSAGNISGRIYHVVFDKILKRQPIFQREGALVFDSEAVVYDYARLPEYGIARRVGGEKDGFLGDLVCRRRSAAVIKLDIEITRGDFVAPARNRIGEPRKGGTDKHRYAYKHGKHAHKQGFFGTFGFVHFFNAPYLILRHLRFKTSPR